MERSHEAWSADPREPPQGAWPADVSRAPDTCECLPAFMPQSGLRAHGDVRVLHAEIGQYRLGSGTSVADREVTRHFRGAGGGRVGLFRGRPSRGTASARPAVRADFRCVRPRTRRKISSTRTADRRSLRGGTHGSPPCWRRSRRPCVDRRGRSRGSWRTMPPGGTATTRGLGFVSLPPTPQSIIAMDAA